MAKSKVNNKLLSQISRVKKSTKMLRHFFNLALDAGNLAFCKTIEQRIKRNNSKEAALLKKLDEYNSLSSWQQFLAR